MVSFKIFLSHSVAPRELGIVYAMANEIAKRRKVPFIPDRNWDPAGNIPIRILSHLKKANCLLAIATSSGSHLQWLKREIKEGIKFKIPILMVADKGIKVPREIKCVKIDRLNPAKTISEVSKELEKFGEDKKTKELLVWFGIGGLLFLLLLGKKK